MTTIPFPTIEFTQEDALAAFNIKYTELRTAFIKHEQSPSNIDEEFLHEYFVVAYPSPEAYLEHAFTTVRETAEKHNLPPSSLPDASLLDLEKEPIAGMGTSLFQRLLYIDKLAAKATQNIIENPEVLVNERILPTLDLLDVNHIFNTLRIESSLQIPRPPEQPVQRSLLSPIFRTNNKPETHELLVGHVLRLQSISKVSGDNLRVATIISQGHGLVDVTLTREQFSSLKIGDYVGFSNVKSASKKHEYPAVDHVSVLVPAEVSKLLKEIDYSFAPFANSDDSAVSTIFGRVVSFDAATRTLTVKDKNGKIEQLKTTSPIEDFGLQQNSVFIAKPTKLRADGFYVIEPQTTLELKAPFAGRLIFGLTKNYSHSAPEKIGQGFEPTEPNIT